MAVYAMRERKSIFDFYRCVQIRKRNKARHVFLFVGSGRGGLFSAASLITTFLTLTLLPYSNAFASVSNITVTDVTSRAFSVVWVSDEPVSSATVRIYSDIDGVVDLTPSFNISVDSSSVPNAHVQGIVKVTVAGLLADTDYYVQTETVGSSGVVTAPAFSSLVLVHTALESVKANDSNLPIVNDVLLYDVFQPDGLTPAPGALVIASVDGASAYPITAFTGENGFAPQTAAIDSSNFFSIDGRSLELIADDALKISVFRGLLCGAEFESQEFFEYRRTPPHEETPVIAEVESPSKCYISDPFCDNTVNVLDVQFVLNSFGNNVGACAYNPGVDVITDGQINVLDVQRVLNDFDATVPSRN